MANIPCSRNTSFAFFLIFFLVHIVAFSTPWWITIGDIRQGLWQICIDADMEYFEGCSSIGDGGRILNTTRAFMCMALVVYIVGFVLHCVWLSRDANSLRQNGAGGVGKGALALEIVGGLFSLIAVSVFGAKAGVDNLSWSFGLAAVSMIVIVITSTITLAVTACCFEPETISQPTPPTTMTVITSTQPNPAPGPQQTGYNQYPPQGPAPFTTPGQQSYPTPPAGAYPTQYPPPNQYNPYPPPAAYPPSSSVSYPQDNPPTYDSSAPPLETKPAFS